MQLRAEKGSTTHPGCGAKGLDVKLELHNPANPRGGRELDEGKRYPVAFIAHCPGKIRLWVPKILPKGMPYAYSPTENGPNEAKY